MLDRPRGRLVLPQAPAANVDDVDAVVAHLAVAGLPEPVPLVVQLLAHQRPLGGRAAPEVVIDGGGTGVGASTLPMPSRARYTMRVGEADGPELAAAQVLERLAKDRARSALRAHLDHAAVLSGRGHHLPAFPHVVGERLLDVDVLARLAGPDRGQGMPMVGRGDDHGVDVLVVEQFADVAVDGDLDAAVFEQLGFPVDVGAVHVAEGDNPRSRNILEGVDELVSPPADAANRGDISQTDDADADIGLRPAPFRGRIVAKDEVWQPQRGGCGDRTLQKLPACCSWHGLAPGLMWAVWTWTCPLVGI